MADKKMSPTGQTVEEQGKQNYSISLAESVQQDERNRQVAKLLLNHLYRGGNFGYFWIVSPDGKKSTQWFKVADGVPDLESSIFEQNNIYFGVHPCIAIPSKNAKGEDTSPENTKGQVALIQAINCVYAEFDFKHGRNYDELMNHLKQLPLYPSVIINSGGGLHCYWLLDPTVTLDSDNRNYIKKLQDEWVIFVDGDKGAKDLARVLRVPGSYNLKPERNKAIVAALDCSFSTYTLEEIERTLQAAGNSVADIPTTTKTTQSQLEFTKVKVGQPELPDFSLAEKLRFAGEMLQKLSPTRGDSYKEWFDVCCALSELGEIGFTLFCDFSAKRKNFKGIEDCKKQWDKCVANKPAGITLNSLKFWVEEDNKAVDVPATVKNPEQKRQELGWNPENFVQNGDDLFEKPFVKQNAFIDGFFYEKQFVLFSGQSATGKSMWLYDAIMAMIGGEYFLTSPMLQPDEDFHFEPVGIKAAQTKCLILNYDMTDIMSEMRIKAGMKGYGLSKDARSNLYTINRVSPDGQDVGMLDVMDERKLMTFAEFITKRDIKVILADGLKQLSKKDTNQADYSLVLDQIQKFVAMTGVCFIAIHHLNKSMSGDIQKDISGTNNLANYCDLALNLYSTDGVNKTIKGAKQRAFREDDVKCYMKFESNPDDRNELLSFRHYAGEIQLKNEKKKDLFEVFCAYAIPVLQKNGEMGKMTFYQAMEAVLPQSEKMGRNKIGDFLDVMIEKGIVISEKKEGKNGTQFVRYNYSYTTKL